MHGRLITAAAAHALHATEGKERLMKRPAHMLASVLISAVVLVAMPTPAQSQESVTVGYQALHLPDNWLTSGVNFDVARDVSRSWSVAGEFGVAHDGGDELDSDGFNIFHVGGGVRWSQRRDGPAPFGQLLAGVQISTSGTDTDTAFMLQPGGGVHIPIGDRWGLSAQFDYRPVFYREEVVQEVRFAIGARWTRP
jgi:hypothetical protein